LKEIDVPGKRKVSSYSGPEQGIVIACRIVGSQPSRTSLAFLRIPT
jgi:hypothetical protein